MFKKQTLWHPVFVVLGWLAATLWLFKSMGELRSLADILKASNHLDVGWYQKIALHGYTLEPEITDGQSTVFFPLFPLLAAPFVHLLALDPLLSLHIVQKLALVLMAFLAYRWSAAAGLAAKESLVSLLVHPAWVFLLIPYSESVYLCCLFGLLLAWQQKSALAFFVSAFLLGLCRPTGLFLIPAAGLTLGFCVVQEYKKYRMEAVAAAQAHQDQSPNLRQNQNQTQNLNQNQNPSLNAVVAKMFADSSLKTNFLLLGSGVAGAFAALGTVALIMHLSVGDWYAFYRYRSLWKEEPSVRYFLSALNLDFGSQTPRILATWAALWGSALLLRSGRIFEGMLCTVSILLPVYQGKMGDIIRYTLGAAPAWMMLSEQLKEKRSLQLAFVAACAAYGVVLCYRWLARDWVG